MWKYRGAWGLLRISDFILSKSATDVVTSLRDKSIKKVAGLTIGELNESTTGSLSGHILSDTGQIYSVVAFSIGDFITSIATLLFISISLLYLNVLLTGILVICFIPLIFIFAMIGKIISRYSYQLQSAIARLNQNLINFFSNYKTVKSTDSEKFFIERARVQTNSLKKVGYKQAKLTALSEPFESGIVMMAFILIILISGTLMNRGQLSLGTLVAYIMLVVQIIDPIMVLGSFSNTLHGIEGATTKLREIFKMRGEKNKFIGIPMTKVKELEFRDVSFSYSKDQDFTLRNLSFTLSRGDRLVIFAPNGTGKKTIFSLIEQFWKPTHGKILINDNDISSYSLSSLHGEIGYVVQEHPIVEGSILDNLILGHSKTMRQVEQACKRANILEYVMNQSRKFDTHKSKRVGKIFLGDNSKRLPLRDVY